MIAVAKLFTPYGLGGVALKNRVVMSPMCTYSCMAEDGRVTPGTWSTMEPEPWARWG